VEKWAHFPQTTSQPMAWHSLRGINLACWRKLFEKIFIGKMSQFPLKYVTTWQEKPVEWLTYSPVTLDLAGRLAISVVVKRRVARWYIYLIPKIQIWIYFGGTWNGHCLRILWTHKMKIWISQSVNNYNFNSFKASFNHRADTCCKCYHYFRFS
jgi:hypothetical protein